MDFTTRLVERGFIVAVHGESYDSTDFNEIIEQTVNVHERLEELNNSSTGPVLGSYGQFDLTHWGFGGHGRLGLSKEEDNYIIANWKKSSLYKNYKIKTIPRYLLFDKNGKIIDDDAPRPSENELIKLIKASI